MDNIGLLVEGQIGDRWVIDRDLRVKIGKFNDGNLDKQTWWL